MAVPQHLLENKFFRQFAGKFPRSPRQANYLLKGGTEIICLENGVIFALTTGSIVEEIANLFTESGGDLKVYLSKLVQIHESWKQH